MSNSPSSFSFEDNNSSAYQLPLASMVRALCKAATTGPDLLYEVMLKLTLMIDTTAQTYGLATWAQKLGERPRLKWVEGLNQDEIADAETAVTTALSAPNRIIEPKCGDRAICLVLNSAGPNREGAAIYGRCVRPLTENQAKEIRILSDVAQLAHAHVSLKGSQQPLMKTMPSPVVAASTLPGMVFNSRAMSAVSRAVERIK